MQGEVCKPSLAEAWRGDDEFQEPAGHGPAQRRMPVDKWVSLWGHGPGVLPQASQDHEPTAHCNSLKDPCWYTGLRSPDHHRPCSEATRRWGSQCPLNAGAGMPWGLLRQCPPGGAHRHSHLATALAPHLSPAGSPALDTGAGPGNCPWHQCSPHPPHPLCSGLLSPAAYRTRNAS